MACELAFELVHAREVVVIVQADEGDRVDEAERDLQSRVDGDEGEGGFGELVEAGGLPLALAAEGGGEVGEVAAVVVGSVGGLVGDVCGSERGLAGEEVVEARIPEGFEVEQVADVLEDGPAAVGAGQGFAGEAADFVFDAGGRAAEAIDDIGVELDAIGEGEVALDPGEFGHVRLYG